MASFDKAAFEKKAFKFVPYLTFGKNYICRLVYLLLGKTLTFA